MSIEKSLTAFRESFPYVKCNVNEDSIVYNIPHGYTDIVAKEANDLIASMKLPLEAKSNSQYGFMFNSVLVTKK